jgi:hypothetical protein
MGCKSGILDLTNNGEAHFRIDKLAPSNKQHIVRFSNLATLGGTHILTAGANTYTVGSGLTVVGDDILWTFTNGQFTTKTVGKIENNGSSYYRIKITIWLQ